MMLNANNWMAWRLTPKTRKPTITETDYLILNGGEEVEKNQIHKTLNSTNSGFRYWIDYNLSKYVCCLFNLSFIYFCERPQAVSSNSSMWFVCSNHFFFIFSMLFLLFVEHDGFAFLSTGKYSSNYLKHFFYLISIKSWLI